MPTLENITVADAIRRGRCDRCRRRIAKDKGANLVFKAGILTGFICSTCQTPEDHIEAEVNAAVLDYAATTTDAFGRAVVPLKSEAV